MTAMPGPSAIGRLTLILGITLAACGDGHDGAGRSSDDATTSSATSELTSTSLPWAVPNQSGVGEGRSQPSAEESMTLVDLVIGEVDHMYPDIIDVSLDRSSVVTGFHSACAQARRVLSRGRSVDSAADSILAGLGAPTGHVSPLVYGLELYLSRGGCGNDPMIMAIGPAVARSARS